VAPAASEALSETPLPADRATGDEPEEVTGLADDATVDEPMDMTSAAPAAAASAPPAEAPCLVHEPTEDTGVSSAGAATRLRLRHLLNVRMQIDGVTWKWALRVRNPTRQHGDAQQRDDPVKQRLRIAEAFFLFAVRRWVRWTPVPPSQPTLARSAEDIDELLAQSYASQRLGR